MAAMTTLAAARPLDPQRLTIHLDRLRSLARHLCHHHGDVEDLVQDTLEQVLRRPRMVQGSESAYLVRAMHNAHVSRIRAARSRVQTTTLHEHFEPQDRVAEDRPMQAGRAREVLQAVAALSDAYRDAVVLVDIRGMRSSEAARALGVAEGTLASRLFRGRAEVARACGA
jgi:RNA polymerase sigma-70 factor (ECF subfamily)